MKTPTILLLFLLCAGLCTTTLQAAPFLVPNTNPPLASVTLAWSASTDPTVTGYNIYQGVGSGQYTNVIDAGSNLSISVSNLVRGSTYYFAATAYNAARFESAYSGEVSYRPVGPPTNAPTMKPLVVLTVQTKTDVQDFQWADLFTVPLDPLRPYQQFRVAAALGPAALPVPTLRKVGLPPLPGQ